MGNLFTGTHEKSDQDHFRESTKMIEPPWPEGDPGPPEPPDEYGRRTLASQLLSVSDLGRLPPVEPLVDGLLYRNTLAQLAGPPGSYKSFISVGLSCAVAAGRGNWAGHRIKRREKVVYVAAEGASGLRVRILAWCESEKVDPADLEGWLHILPMAVQLGAVIQVDEAVEMVGEIGAGLLVLDTRARCTLGLEENSATEQGRAVDAGDRIRTAADCTVWAIHHTGRNGSTPRGSTAWDGAVWTDLRLSSEDGTAAISVEKHKDAPSNRVYDYRLVAHTVSQRLMPGVEEESRKSLVVFPHSSGNLDEIPTEVGKKVGTLCGNSCGVEGLTRAQLVALVLESGIPKTTAYRALNQLIKHGLLRAVNPDAKTVKYVYTASEAD